MASKTNMTEADFRVIKSLLDVGAARGVIKQATRRAYGTINYVQRSSDFADYRRQITEQTKRWRDAKKNASYPGVGVYVPTVEVPEMEEAVQAPVQDVNSPELIVALTELSNSMKELAGALEVKDTWTKRLLGN